MIPMCVFHLIVDLHSLRDIVPPKPMSTALERQLQISPIVQESVQHNARVNPSSLDHNLQLPPE